MSTHLKALSESYLLNTNTTGFRLFPEILRPCGLDESSLSIGRVNDYTSSDTTLIPIYKYQLDVFFRYFLEIDFDFKKFLKYM